MKVQNLWGEERNLKHNKMFEVCSNFNNSQFINSPDEESAILKFKQIHPRAGNLIEAKECKLPKSADISLIVEV